MFKLYNKVFIVLYNSIKIYENYLSDFNSWNKKIKEYNLIINTAIFENLKKTNPRNHQILHNCYNYYINFHIRNRSLSRLKKYSKFQFIIWLCFTHFSSYFQQAKEYLKNQITYYPQVHTNNDSISIAFGFPAHAFNYSDKQLYQSSFIEYIMSNKLIDENDFLVSIDEYIRKSKKDNIEPLKNINSFKRIKLKSKIDYARIFIIPFNLIKDIISYLYEYRNFNFNLFIYYLSQKSKFKPLIDFLIRIEKKNDIAKVYLLDNLDLNQSLINKKFSKYFHTFCYSQNCLVNNNNLISLLNTGKSIENKIQKNIFQDLNHNIFKYYRLNAINFSKQTFFYSEIRKVANQIYGLNLITNDTRVLDKTNQYSNLGYEQIERLNLENGFNILILDNTSETLEHNFKHFFLGVLSGLESFISEFNNDIISLSKNFKINFYYKAKYGNNDISINNILKSTKKYKSEIKIVDSYSKIEILDGQKFDLNINLPYTSTNFTLSSIAKKSIYYIPSRYSLKIKNKPFNLLIGREQLNNFIRKNYGKNRR